MRSLLSRAIVATANRYPAVLGHLNASALKTYAFYASSIRDLTKKLYDGKVAYLDFVSKMENLITVQLRLAWFEGMEANGLAEDDMTTEWAGILREIIMSEQDHVAEFALVIEGARRAESPVDPLLSRADLWGNRYNDVVNQARVITAGEKDKMIWVLGETDEHCHNGDGGRMGIGCAELAGLVAYASEWDASGIKPQGQMLNCGGWNCRCELKPTNKRRTKNVTEILGI